MDIFGNVGSNPFDQALNTYDNVDFTRVDVTDAIVDNSQLATKLYVDTHGGGGGGGGDMNYVGTTPATNFIYKAASSDGKSATKSNIVDTGATVTVITTLQCLALDGQAMGGNLNIGNNQATVTILADCIADKFVKSGGTAIQYLMGDGSTLTQSATSGNSNFYLYQNKDGVMTPPPLSGDLGYNNSVQANATIVYISHLTQDVIDVEVFFKQVNQLSDLYIQDKEDSTNWIKYNITALPTLNIGSYLEVPVSMASYGGTGNTSFGSNHRLLVAFFSNLTEIDQRLSTLETKTTNQTAVAGNTTMSGLLTAGQLRYVSTMYSGPGGDMTIGGIGNNITLSAGQNITLTATNGVIINSSLTANSFIKSGGLATEFLKANGTVDANTYLTSASGYPFNPVWRATATITASTKSYWFVVLHNQATLISGFSLYLDQGSDVFRMGIYRGKVSTGGSMTLCGQSGGGALPTIDIYARVPITAVSGQNLTFSNGEYMTIAFHSQGSTNVFLTGQTTVATWVELGYNSNTNYAAAGFPATLTSTSVLGAIPNRPCFELY
jgi:hypothetical protein